MTSWDRARVVAHTGDVDETLLGVAVDRERLTAVVRRVTGRPDAVINAVSVRPASHRVENMTTRALTHVWGTLSDGTPWPPFAQEDVRSTLDWQDEPRVYTSRLAEDLPPGLRLPTLYAVDEAEEHRVATELGLRRHACHPGHQLRWSAAVELDGEDVAEQLS